VLRSCLAWHRASREVECAHMACSAADHPPLRQARPSPRMRRRGGRGSAAPRGRGKVHELVRRPALRPLLAAALRAQRWADAWLGARRGSPWPGRGSLRGDPGGLGCRARQQSW